jgi:hypothetical protein
MTSIIPPYSIPPGPSEVASDLGLLVRIVETEVPAPDGFEGPEEVRYVNYDLVVQARMGDLVLREKTTRIGNGVLERESGEVHALGKGVHEDAVERLRGYMRMIGLFIRGQRINAPSVEFEDGESLGFLQDSQYPFS